MAKLNIILPDNTKPEDEQLESIFVGMQEIQKWANTTASTLPFNQSAQAQSITTPEYSNTTVNSVFTAANTIALFIMNLTLQGSGSLALILNNQTIREIPFDITTASTFSFTLPINLNIGNNQIRIQAKGTVNITSPSEVSVVSLNS